MRKPIISCTAVMVLLMAVSGQAPAAEPTGWTLIGWNDLGMHCMDADFAVLSILPPYNTIHAQLVDPSGDLVTDATGITVTYRAVADPDASINTTSIAKTNFWDYVLALFGASLGPDRGLAGHDMPGATNTPQAMVFDSSRQWFSAEGIPITPYDDSHSKNYYPMMRLEARDLSGSLLATTDIVLPVSDEMTCRSCHGSGAGPAAEPRAGWVDDPDPERDYRLNILLLHDEMQDGDPSFQAALAAAMYNPLGLYPTATGDGVPVLCAACHGSNALPGTGQAGISALTAAVHGLHATVVDPGSGMTLDASDNRSACYTCHPGSETRCLRGAMGNAVATDGELAMQCQSCHGTMSVVGDSQRVGWFDEPTCQNCHTGTAVHNNGQIRYTTVYDGSGERREAVDQTFATDPDTPLAGFSLYRFSTGHGGLQCEACHGSTHAVFPSSHLNDNLQSLQLQGHVGTLVECETCHGGQPRTVTGGPHGMHPVGQSWVDRHESAAEDDPTGCRTCHGADYRGTVLSRSQGDQVVETEFGTKEFWRGFQIGCYTCHNGPREDDRNPNRAPAVEDRSANTSVGVAVDIALGASDADGDPLELRVVRQPANGTAGLLGTTATYFPFAGFEGTDTFSYAAWDGSTDSNLATVTVAVASTGCTVSCSASVPSSGTVGTPVAFQAAGTAQGCAGGLDYEWRFGDGSPVETAQNPSHTYATAGSYTWTVTVSSGGASCTRSGEITIAPLPVCTLTCSAEVVQQAQVGKKVEFHGHARGSCTGQTAFEWDFGDGSGLGFGDEVDHTYSAPGTYTWRMRATRGEGACETAGVIVVSGRRSAGGRH